MLSWLSKAIVTAADLGTVMVVASKAMFRTVRFTVTFSGADVIGAVVATVVGVAVDTVVETVVDTAVGDAVAVAVGVVAGVVGVAVAFPCPGAPVHPAPIPTRQRTAAMTML
jgi:hypothetical protein